MHFLRGSGVSSVLESSCMSYTLRLSVRRFLALTQKSLFLEVPLSQYDSMPQANFLVDYLPALFEAE